MEQENERLGRKVRGLEQQLSELEILHSKRVIITKFPVCCCISGQTGSANSRQEVLFLGSRSFARTKKRKGKRKLSAKRSCETNWNDTFGKRKNFQRKNSWSWTGMKKDAFINMIGSFLSITEFKMSKLKCFYWNASNFALEPKVT